MKIKIFIISLITLVLVFSCSGNVEIPKEEETGSNIISPAPETDNQQATESEGQNPQIPESPPITENETQDRPKIIKANLAISQVLESDTDYEFIIPENSTGWIMVMNVTPDGDEDTATDSMTFELYADEIKALWNFSNPYTDAEGYVRWDRMPDYRGSVTSAVEYARDFANHLIYLEDLQTDYSAMSSFLNVLDTLYSHKGGRLIPPDSVYNVHTSMGINEEPEILFETENQKWMIVLLSDFGEDSENTLGIFSNATYLVDTPPVIYINIRAFKDTKETTLDNFACTIIHEYTHFCESWIRYRTNGTADQRTHILSEGLADYIAGAARGMSFSGEAGYIWFWLNDGFLWQPDTDRKADDGTSLDIMNYGLGAMIYSKLASLKGGEIPPDMITDTGAGLLPLENVTGTEAGTFIREMFLDILANLGVAGYEDRNASYLDSFRIRDIFRLYENSSAPIALGISEAEFSRTGVHFYKLPDKIRSFSYNGPGDCIAFSLPRESE